MIFNGGQKRKRKCEMNCECATINKIHTYDIQHKQRRAAEVHNLFSVIQLSESILWIH